MPRLSWNEVKARAITFSRNPYWINATSERAEKQTFYNEFFNVFGVPRPSVACFEVNVRNLQGHTNAIDLLWRGKLIVEHKSRGQSLEQAETQAFGYIEDLTRESRFDAVPRFVLVSDFANFVLYDLDPEEQRNLPLFAGRPMSRLQFPLADFPRHIRAFAFMLGQTRVRLDPEDPANEKAYTKMCGLHDALKAGGFGGHELERLLVRILFCVFAEDTGIFEPESFTNFIRQQTREDGSDIGAQLNQLFDWLNNPQASEQFGQPIDRLPLTTSPHIVQANALRTDWNDVLPRGQCSYVLGNPPFIGKKARNTEQQNDMGIVWGELQGSGTLDYVTCWYRRAAEYIQGTQIPVAFVSTNSISQGEQVGILWDFLFRHYALIINFAHRTFKWTSEARGMAHVHVVIIGFATFNKPPKQIYDYAEGTDNATVSVATNINPYLIAANNVALRNRETPISDIPETQFGCMPNDDGNFLFTDAEKTAFLADEPQSAPFFRQFLSAHEYFNGEDRWCLWLQNAEPALVRGCPKVQERIEAVRVYRSASSREATKRLAQTPALFGEIRAPQSRFVLIPRHSSENRNYIPFSYFEPVAIPADSCIFLEDATLFHFGVLSSSMHMAWVKQVCGRLESRYRYSSKLVYNNFPWPNPTPAQITRVEEAAQAVLDARAPHLPPRGMSTLADLYDPNTMPPELHRAHAELDRAVERCYRADRFTSDRERVEFLFRLYEQLTAPLLPATPRARGRRRLTQRE